MALNFISVSNRAFRGDSEFSPTELVTFLELMETEFDRNYDAMKIINVLENKNLPSCAYTRLTKMYEEGEPFVRIMTKAISCCTYSSLVHALYECGYSDIANKMENFIVARGNAVTVDAIADVVSKIDGSHSSALALYYSLKRNVDNATFLDKNEFLKFKTQQLSSEFQHLDPEMTSRRSCIIDKLLVTYCVSVEVVTDVSSRLERLNTIRNNETVHESQLSEAILTSKEGATYALKGDFERAEELMFRARVSLQHFKPSWATYYHYMGEVFLKVALFSRCPNDDTKSSLLFYGFAGLRSVGNEDEETQRFWKRIYLSFMLYGLLGVNLLLSEVTVEITADDRTIAKSLLSEFNRLSRGMETRRDMVYAFLMAKLVETEDLELAITYAKRAETLSKAGGVLRTGETENISTYVMKLSSELAFFTDKITLLE